MSTHALVSQPELDPECSRRRQRRVLECMQQLRVDRAVVVAPEHVQYLTGFVPHRLLPAAVALEADGTCILAAANQQPKGAAVDRVVTFEAQWHATLRQERTAVAASALGAAVRGRAAARVAVEFSRGGVALLEALGVSELSRTSDLEPTLRRLRRHKEPDELAMIRHAIGCTDAMYRAAREAIEPGITELELFNILQSAAVTAAGEPLTALGNDFQCNAPGGPPRKRAAEAGELFILDLGPAYRGWYADNCRTFAVDGRPTDRQLEAWEAIVAVLRMVEATVRPGVSCSELFARAQQQLDEFQRGGFCHHLGHGIGLEPHEAPHLNPHWDEVFEEGDVFTAEPGLYADELRAGIRLEENYRVTADGVERLTSFPLDL
ncbi:M24 family metallopeptidase [Candidatus Laterigemmans baculatus]|uniref:M24 family metallopeptidase n=1 Tax=Candidatus Laterigemmans baculatus TaxID=2770505 RepID=UPI0013DCF752|nr:Xaa-Pro peptidase family protein [Candidatus Laterigemmans baculatus]